MNGSCIYMRDINRPTNRISVHCNNLSCGRKPFPNHATIVHAVITRASSIFPQAFLLKEISWYLIQWENFWKTCCLLRVQKSRLIYSDNADIWKRRPLPKSNKTVLQDYEEDINRNRRNKALNNTKTSETWKRTWKFPELFIIFTCEFNPGN